MPPKGVCAPCAARDNTGVLYGREVGNIIIQVPTKELENIIAKHSISSSLINLNMSNGGRGRILHGDVS